MHHNRYNATAQGLVLPNIITIAAVLDAVPLEDGDAAIDGASLEFDALTVLADMDARDATEYCFDRYANATSTMSKMNPGYDQSQAKRHPARPPLTGTIDPGTPPSPFALHPWLLHPGPLHPSTIVPLRPYAPVRPSQTCDLCSCARVR